MANPHASDAMAVEVIIDLPGSGRDPTNWEVPELEKEDIFASLGSARISRQTAHSEFVILHS